MPHDSLSRPLCRVCMHPMTRAPRLDHFSDGCKVRVFECVTHDDVELVMSAAQPEFAQRAA